MLYKVMLYYFTGNTAYTQCTATQSQSIVAQCNEIQSQSNVEQCNARQSDTKV